MWEDGDAPTALHSIDELPTTPSKTQQQHLSGDTALPGTCPVTQLLRQGGW